MLFTVYRSAGRRGALLLFRFFGDLQGNLFGKIEAGAADAFRVRGCDVGTENIVAVRARKIIGSFERLHEFSEKGIGKNHWKLRTPA